MFCIISKITGFIEKNNERGVMEYVKNVSVDSAKPLSIFYQWKKCVCVGGGERLVTYAGHIIYSCWCFALVSSG